MNDLLIVFSNYNGMRTCNDYKVPRITACLNSFLTYYTSSNTNALLLDNNSSDESPALLDKYSSSSWIVRKKQQEDYYLGTLYYLAKEFANQYKYLMLVDNDQYFIRGKFLESALQVLDQNEDIVCFQNNEPTIADALDHKKTDKLIVGIFDSVQQSNDDIWMRSAQFSGKESFFQPVSEERGSGIINIKGSPPKRLCWLAYGYFNVIIRTEAVNKIFHDKRLALPYAKNSDRLAIFSSNVYNYGRTAYFAKGTSINIGFRKYLSKEYDVSALIENHKKEHKSLLETDGHSFFLQNDKLCSIEAEISKVQFNAQKTN